MIARYVIVNFGMVQPGTVKDRYWISYLEIINVRKLRKFSFSKHFRFLLNSQIIYSMRHKFITWVIKAKWQMHYNQSNEYNNDFGNSLISLWKMELDSPESFQRTKYILNFLRSESCQINPESDICDIVSKIKHCSKKIVSMQYQFKAFNFSHMMMIRLIYLWIIFTKYCKMI